MMVLAAVCAVSLLLISVGFALGMWWALGGD